MVLNIDWFRYISGIRIGFWGTQYNISAIISVNIGADIVDFGRYGWYCLPILAILIIKNIGQYWYWFWDFKP